MLTLGGGFHYCVGVHLAGLELAKALSVMARRMPNIRRAGPAQWKPLLNSNEAPISPYRCATSWITESGTGRPPVM